MLYRSASDLRVTLTGRFTRPEASYNTTYVRRSLLLSCQDFQVAKSHQKSKIRLKLSLTLQICASELGVSRLSPPQGLGRNVHLRQTKDPWCPQAIWCSN